MHFDLGRMSPALGRPNLSRTGRLGLSGVFCVAALVRFWNIRSSGFIHWDEFVFVHQARDLAEHGWGALHRFTWSAGPVTSLLLGGAMSVVGRSDTAALSVTAMCGALACVATAILGRLCARPRTGVLAGLFLAVSPFAFTYSRLALAESPFLLLFVAVLLCVWETDRTGSLTTAATGGALTGVLTFTKYDGIYGVLLMASWVAIRHALSRLNPLPGAPARSVGRDAALIATWTAAFGVVVGAFMPMIGLQGGLSSLIGSIRTHASIGTNPWVVLSYLSGQTALPIVIAAAGGIVVALARRRDGDVFLLLVFATFLAALTRYVPYPRLGLPLAPIGAIFAALAVNWAAERVARPAIFSALGAILIVAQLPALASVAALRTRGYADAAGMVAAMPMATSVWSRSQASLMLYTDRPRWLNCTEEVGRSLATDEERLLILDQAATWSGFVSDLLELNANRITGETRIANPMYTELLLQPFTWEMWSHRDDPPSAYRVIRLIRTTGPLQMPSQCR